MKATLDRAYRKNRQSDCDRLVMQHLDYVGRILSTMTFYVTDPHERESLHSAGVLGLVQAAAKFDDSQGVPFRTFAYPRIRGAIVDELREQCPVSPKLMKKIGRVKRLCETLEPPLSPEVLAERLEMTLDEVVQCLEAMRFIKPDNWNDLSDVIDEAWGTRTDSPSELVERDELVSMLAHLITELPDRERLIMTLYYDEELNLAEIGAAMGFSESRASRLLASARFRLSEAIRWKTR
ncbi:MAG: sigma-70 family RNA polymerase sigma factor [Planctomycetota bacterium]